MGYNIENAEILYSGRGKRKPLFKIEKKEKLKTKSFQKLQSANKTKAVQVWSWENIFTKTWKLAIVGSISEGCNAWENPSAKTSSENSQIRKLGKFVTKNVFQIMLNEVLKIWERLYLLM